MNKINFVTAQADNGQSFKVLIIGAGTGGASLAHALKRANIAVDVFERDRTRATGREG
ncbi:MAG: NAD(P)-binding protein [Caldilineaceae bacterium]|nr:NAD(P)-binding protein [Caldilineaceae bacterium]